MFWLRKYEPLQNLEGTIYTIALGSMCRTSSKYSYHRGKPDIFFLTCFSVRLVMCSVETIVKELIT